MLGVQTLYYPFTCLYRAIEPQIRPNFGELLNGSVCIKDRDVGLTAFGSINMPRNLLILFVQK